MNKNIAVSAAVFVVLGPIIFGVVQSFFDMCINQLWAIFHLAATLGIIVGYVFGIPLAVFLAWMNIRLSDHWLLKMTAVSLGCSLLWYALLSYQQVWDLVQGRAAGWGDFVLWAGVMAIASTIASLVSAGIVRAILKWRPR